MPESTTSTIVRISMKGQITVPIAIRRALNLPDRSLLQISLEGEQIVITSLESTNQDPARIYTDEEVAEIIEADVIPPELAAWVRTRFRRRTK